jgi:hypothetical protein
MDSDRDASQQRGTLIWLWVAVAGLALAFISGAIAVYRYRRDAGQHELVAWDEPATIVATIGLAMTAVGVLAALTRLTLGDAATAEQAVARGAPAAAAWVLVAGTAVAAFTYAAVADVRIGHDLGDLTAVSAGTPLPGGSPLATPTVPGSSDRVELTGAVTLDGAPLAARFLGATVVRDGLQASCQAEIPAVTDGRYRLPVVTDAEVRGCGGPGAVILLWAFTDRYYFSTSSLPWPSDGKAVTFDVAFSSEQPDGVREAVTELKGKVLRADGSPAPGGAVIEAYIGDTRCGLGSVRYSGFVGYNLSIAGPSKAGCDAGKTVTFSVDGTAVPQTVINDLGQGTASHELDLTIE